MTQSIDPGVRTVEEIEGRALSYAEFKALASGNPYIREKVEVDTELSKLERLASEYQFRQYENQKNLSSIPAGIAQTEENIESLNHFISISPGKDSIIKLGDQSFKLSENSKEAGEEINKAAIKFLNNDTAKTKVIAEMGKFDIQVLRSQSESFYSRSEGEDPYSKEITPESDIKRLADSERVKLRDEYQTLSTKTNRTEKEAERLKELVDIGKEQDNLSKLKRIFQQVSLQIIPKEKEALRIWVDNRNSGIFSSLFSVDLGNTGGWTINKIQSAFDGLNKQLTHEKDYLVNINKRKTELERLASKPFEYSDKLENLRKRRIELEQLLKVKEGEESSTEDGEINNEDNNESESKQIESGPKDSFYVYRANHGYEKVEGKPIDLGDAGQGYKYFSYKEGKTYKINEDSTGLRIGEGNSLKDVINNANNNLKNKTKKDVDEVIQGHIKDKGISPRYNDGESSHISSPSKPLQFGGKDIKLNRDQKEVKGIFGSEQERKNIFRRITSDLFSSKRKAVPGFEQSPTGIIKQNSNPLEAIGNRSGQNEQPQSNKLPQRTVRQDWVRQAYVSFTGRQLSPNYVQDIADLHYIYRDPKTESTHFIGIDENKKIVGNSVFTSDAADYVQMTNRNTGQAINNLIAQGAKSIVLLHNHPSGDPTPSNDDYTTCRKWAEIVVLQSDGEVKIAHSVIINGDKFASFDPNTKEETKFQSYSNPLKHKYQEDYDKYDRTDRPEIKNVQDAAEYFAELKYGKGIVALVSIDPDRKVMGYEYVLSEEINTPGKLSDRLNSTIENIGGNRIIIVGDESDIKPKIKGRILYSQSANNIYASSFFYKDSKPILTMDYINYPAPEKANMVKEDSNKLEIENSAYERGLELFNSGATKFNNWRKEMFSEFPKENLHRIFLDVLRNAKLNDLGTATEINNAISQKESHLAKGLSSLENEIPPAGKGPMIYERARTVIKDKIKQFKKGWEAGRKDTTAELTTLKRLISNYAREFLPKTLIKSEITPLLTSIVNAKNLDDVEKAFDRVDNIVTHNDKNYLLRNIHNILEKFKAIKEKGILKGKHLTSEEYETLGDIRKITSLPADKVAEITAHIFDRLENSDEEPDLDTKEFLYQLQTFSNLKDKSVGDLANVYDELTNIVKTGKTKHNAILEQKQEEFQQVRNAFVDTITGGKGIKSEEEARATGLSKQKRSRTEWIRKYDLKNQNLEWLLDNLSKYDKDSAPLESALNKYIIPKVLESRNNEMTETSKMFKAVSDKIGEIFGANKLKLVQILNKNTVRQNTGIYIKKDGKPIELELSQNEAYKKWMEYQDPALKPTFDKMGWTPDTMQEIENWLTPEVKKWAEWQMKEFYPKYYESVNDVFKKQFFIDLPKNEFYSPISRIAEGEDNFDDQLLRNKTQYASVLNGHLKSRIRNTRPLKIIDGDISLANHIIAMEHYKNWTDTIAAMRSILGSEAVQKAISQYHGKEAKNILNGFIDDLARGGIDRKLIVGFADKLRGRFAKSVLGANPVIFVKQLTTLPGFVAEIPTADFMKGLGYFFTHPKECIDTLKESKMLQYRYHVGWERDVIQALQRSVPRELAGTKSYANALMVLMGLGDKAAAFAGGYSVYKYHYDKFIKQGMPVSYAKKQAMLQYELAVKRVIQAGNTEDLSTYQRGGSMMKLFTMFRTQPNVYYRQVSNSLRNSINGRDRWGSLKRIFVFHFLLPMLFQWAASGFPGVISDMNDKNKMRMLRSAVLGSFNGLLMAGNILEEGANYISGDTNQFDYEMTPVGQPFVQSFWVMKELYKILDGATTLDWDEVWKIAKELASVVSFGVGFPLTPLKRNYKGIENAVDNGIQSPADVLKTLGYSEHALGETLEKGGIAPKSRNLIPGMNLNELDNMMRVKSQFGIK